MTNNEDNDYDLELEDEDEELGDQDERPFPDSDEAIRALQDVAESVDELEAEIARLRADLKTALAERDDARRMYCLVRMRISNKPEPTDTSQSLGWEGLWQGRPHSNSETRKKNQMTTQDQIVLLEDNHHL